MHDQTERRWDRVVETITVTRDSENVGWGFMPEPEGGYQYPPMGAELPNDYPAEPLVSGTARTIVAARRGMVMCDEVKVDSFYLRGEQIGWVPIPADWFTVELLKKIASGKRKSWEVSCQRFRYEDTGEWVH